MPSKSSSKLRFSVLFILGTAACSTTTPVEVPPASDKSADLTAPETPAPPCVDLDEAACAAREACQAVKGRAYVARDGGWCTADYAFVACQPTPEACGDALTTACAPDGAVHIFDDTCVPPGWAVCEPPADAPIDVVAPCKPTATAVPATDPPPPDPKRATCEAQCKGKSKRDALGGNSAPSPYDECVRACLE